VERVMTEAPSHGYAHFACHGSFDAGDPAASGLQLANNQRLAVLAIVRDLTLDRCRLVTLSACETAMVDVQHLPDECVGLPAAFLQAGAPGVVATLWSVYDRPTVRLMPQFYRAHLKEGKAPAAALREAVLWLRQQTDTALGGGQVSNDPFGAPIDIGDDPREAPDPTPRSPVNLYSLSIVWAAYSYHGV
jgi:CHAT domain-containing protein